MLSSAVGLSALRHLVTVAGAAALFTGKIDPTDITTISEGLQMAGGLAAVLTGVGLGAANAKVGNKSADQSGLIASLQADLAKLETERTAAREILARSAAPLDLPPDQANPVLLASGSATLRGPDDPGARIAVAADVKPAHASASSTPAPKKAATRKKPSTSTAKTAGKK